MSEIINNIFFWSNVIVLGILIWIWIRWNRYKAKVRKEIETEIRKDSLKRSKSIIRGSVNEEILPLFSEFPYKISDLKLFGNPIDYVVFDGMSEFRDGNREKEISIIVADLKTGKASKTPVQNAIKRAIESGRIRFEEWRVDENNKLNIK